jgi:hypothetical protein
MADQPQAEPVGGVPMMLDPATARRIEAAVGQVEGYYRNRPPGGLRGPRGNDSPGAWGFLPAGDTITGASGMTLGSGTVTLCSRSGDTCDDDGDEVTVYNAGGAVTAGSGGRVCKLGWTDGTWSLDVFPCA